MRNLRHRRWPFVPAPDAESQVSEFEQHQIISARLRTAQGLSFVCLVRNIGSDK